MSCAMSQDASGAVPSTPALNARFPIVDLTAPREVNIPIIKASCLDLGFFCITNSQISVEEIKTARAVAKEFFALPVEKKSEYPLTFSGGELFGYAAIGAESADVANVSLEKNTVPDLMESFQVADVDRVDNKFPLLSMKSVLESLYRKKRALAVELLSLLAESLDLPADYFIKMHFTGKHRSILRVTKYPPLKECTTERGAGVSRISAHQDIGSITLLTQDQCGGLEVFDQKADCGKGQWLPVTPMEGCMVINIGNLLMRWTNFTYRSSVHRVVSTPKSDDEERISVIFFVNPNDDAIVSAVGTTVSTEKPAAFEPFTVDEYLSCKFTQLFDPNAKQFKGKCRFDD